MRLGIVSDTHGHAANTQAAITLLQSLEVERVLHCGDIGTPLVAKMFVDWPTDFVFGNCDYHRQELTEAIQAAGQTCHGDFADLEIEGRRIALLHSHDCRKFQEVCTGGQYDLVCYGHTHEAKLEQFGKTQILNPGALYRANPHSVATVDLPKLTIQHVSL